MLSLFACIQTHGGVVAPGTQISMPHTFLVFLIYYFLDKWMTLASFFKAAVLGLLLVLKCLAPLLSF